MRLIDAYDAQRALCNVPNDAWHDGADLRIALDAIDSVPTRNPNGDIAIKDWRLHEENENN